VDYYDFVRDVSTNSAARWRANLGRAQQRNELLWRLLRMQAAPYFVLGAQHDNTPMQYRVDTPWDFSRHNHLLSFEVKPGQRRQPSVDWAAHIQQAGGQTATVKGHVEVRWSHGKLNGPPEAKVYLDTDPHEIPGYKTLDPPR